MKTCKKCGSENLSGAGVCRDCRAEYMRKWNARNPEKVKASKSKRDPAKVKAERDRDREKNRAKRYATRDACYAKSREHYLGYKKAYYEANKERMAKSSEEARKKRMAADPAGERKKRAEYAAKRRREDPQYLIYGRISCLMRQHLKSKGRNGTKAGRQWPTLVGYTLDELIAHLKGRIPEGYVWEDYLSGELEVDHITPDEKFSYQSVDDPDFRRSWALDNLRLLHWRANSERRYQP